MIRVFFKKKTTAKPAESTLTREQAFAARPMAVKVDERQPLKNGGVRLTVPFNPTATQRVLLRIPEHARRRVELDAVGAKVFAMCDGKTSVREIARRFAREHQVDEREADAAVVAFMRMLMQKRLVVMGLDKH